MSRGFINRVMDYLADGDIRSHYNSTSASIGSVSGNDIKTLNLNIASSPAKNKTIAGFSIGASNRLAMSQCYCSSESNIVVRVVNVSSSAQSGGSITVYYY